MILLTISPEYSDEETTCCIEGEDEQDVANVLAARLLAADWEVVWEESESED